MQDLAAQVLAHSDLPAIPKLILAIMALRSDDRGACRLPLVDLAISAGVALSTAQSCLKTLQATGHLRLIQPGGGARHPNVWQVLP